MAEKQLGVAPSGPTDATTKGYADTKRVGFGSTSAGALTINADLYNGFVGTITANTTITITGSPGWHQPLMLEFTATAAYTLTFILTGTNQVANSGVATTLATTVANKFVRMGLIYNTTKTAWMAVATDAAGY